MQTLARVPSAAAAAEVAEDTADDAAEDIAEDAEDVVDDVDPPHAVTVTANAAVAHDASTAFQGATTVHSFLGCFTG